MACKKTLITTTQGAQGPAGSNGTNGTDGAQGLYGGYSSDWAFETSTASAPPSGAVRLNNGTENLVDTIYLGNDNTDGVDMANFFTSFNSVGTSGNRGFIRLYKEDDSSIFWLGKVNDATVNASDTELDVTYLHHSKSFSATDSIVVSFVGFGDTGATGPAGAAGATGANGSDGSDMWDDLTTPSCLDGTHIVGFDAAANSAKTDLLITWLCSLGTTVGTLSASPVVSDAEYDVECGEQVRILLTNFYDGIYPPASVTVESTVPPNNIENGTLTQVGTSYMYVFESDGTCSTTADFSYQFTDTQGNTSNIGTITINIGTLPDNDVPSTAKVGSAWATAVIALGNYYTNVDNGTISYYRWKETEDTVHMYFDGDFEIPIAGSIAAGNTIGIVGPDAWTSVPYNLEGRSVAILTNSTTGTQHACIVDVTVGPTIQIEVPSGFTTMNAGETGTIEFAATFEKL